MCSGGLDIWVLSTSFQKNNIHWPQQPPTARVYYISKKWIFDDPFHKKGPVLIILVPGMIQQSRSGRKLMKKGCRGQWGHRGCRGRWGQWGFRGSKAWKITTEDFRVIQVLVLRFLLMFWNTYFFGRLTKYQVDFLQLFLSEALEAGLGYFFENWLMKLKCPHLLKNTRHRDSTKLLILLPLRAI